MTNRNLNWNTNKQQKGAVPFFYNLLRRIICGVETD